MFQTISYKGHYIHISIRSYTEVIEIQFLHGGIQRVKSMHAAKLLITKYENIRNKITVKRGV
jgi:hypothetical protein